MWHLIATFKREYGKTQHIFASHDCKSLQEKLTRIRWHANGDGYIVKVKAKDEY